MSRILADIILFIVLSHGVIGQITFGNITDQLPTRPYVGFLSKGVADLNGDVYDDIVRVHSLDTGGNLSDIKINKNLLSINE